jgi:hypothetical protein
VLQLRLLVAGFPPWRPGFQPRSCHVEFVVDKTALKQGVSRVLQFLLPVTPLTAPHSSSSFIRGWYNRSNSGPRAKWTQSHLNRHVVSVMYPYGSIHGFLDRIPYFFFQIASQLYSQGSVDSVPDPLILRKSGSAGNRTRTSGSVSMNSDH